MNVTIAELKAKMIAEFEHFEEARKTIIQQLYDERDVISGKIEAYTFLEQGELCEPDVEKRAERIKSAIDAYAIVANPRNRAIAEILEAYLA